MTNELLRCCDRWCVC